GSVRGRWRHDRGPPATQASSHLEPPPSEATSAGYRGVIDRSKVCHDGSVALRSNGAARGARTKTRDAGRGAITPDKVIDTAMEIVKGEGLAALSMRRLAAELGVQTPTVYWHVGNRDELLKRLIERQTDQLGNIRPRGTTPAARISSILRTLLAEVRSRPHLIELSTTQGRGEAVFTKAE